MDFETGLPSLPEGYFWRVKSASSLLTAPKVQLRKKMWIGSYVVDDAWTLDEFHSAEQEVRYLAMMIWDRQRAEQERILGLARVVGDYPPKRLS